LTQNPCIVEKIKIETRCANSAELQHNAQSTAFGNGLGIAKMSVFSMV